MVICFDGAVDGLLSTARSSTWFHDDEARTFIHLMY